MNRTSLLLLAFVVGCSTTAGAQPAEGPRPDTVLNLKTGKQVYEAGCVSCHGPDGKGQPQDLSGFEPPSTFPDFSDCPTSTPEPDVQWRAIIANGGPARGFSRIMPAFRNLLTSHQIDLVIGYLRGMCAERAWPRGDLNLPRALVTEKAFPENETVVTASINAQGEPGVTSTLIYERRIGASAMIEAIVPYEFTHDSGNWAAAFGDLALGYKQKLFHSLEKGTIFSAGGELSVPTGNPSVGTGGESTVFEAFGTYGQLLPADSFLQLHTGVELPAHPDQKPRAYYLRTAIGKTFATDNGLGRRWSPIVEFIADRDLVSGATTNWDIIPELQMPMNKRMHILGNVGFKFPANNTAGRPRQLLFYVLWDWADGGLLQGW
jgi:mono/diheme cytochrome c family protein